MKLNCSIIIALGITLIYGSSCKKYLEIGEPQTQLSRSALFDNDGTATGAQLAIYAQMETQGILYNLMVNTGLSADELKLNISAPVYLDVANNNLTDDNPLIETHWNDYYKLIYQANAVIEGLEHSSGITETVKKQLRGEALLVRAFFHFYLLNLYGDIPIALSTDYTINASLSRRPITEVYTFIIEDLQQAADLLDENYKGPDNSATTERVRPNRFTAFALMARVYLYLGNWTKAEETASLVINKSSLYELSADLNAVFLKNSKEQIWQIMPVLPDFNTFAGAMFVVTGPPTTVYLDPIFVGRFQQDDQRRSAWIRSYVSGNDTYFFPYKFKQGYGSASITEYTSVLRLSEQYLIRAEARAMQDNLVQGEGDLNMIRIRAGLLPISSLPKQNLLDSIQSEKQSELFTEAGDRWLNLKRSGKANDILSTIKGANWNSNDQLYPIPQNELLRNTSLKQNPGY